MVASRNMIPRKTEADLDAMRPACRLARRILDEVCDWARPGVTTLEVDEFAAKLIETYGAKSAFLGYRNYPCHVCISPNEQVVHGIADSTTLEYGDIVSIDVGVVFKGFIGDNARTIAVGGCDSDREFLLGVTEAALHRGIEQARSGNRVVNIEALNGFEEGAVVDVAAIRSVGLANGTWDGIKILGDGEFGKKLTVKAHAFSASARAKIETSGGVCEVVTGRLSG